MMRRGWGFGCALACAMLLVTTAADAATVIGGPGNDHLFGTNDADDMQGRGGDDNLFGRDGNDVIQGDGQSFESGIDSIFPGGGSDKVNEGATLGGSARIFDDDGRATKRERRDVLKGGDGTETIFSADGEPDVVRCGRGDDTAFVDRKDDVRGCETKIKKTGQSFGAFTAFIGTNVSDDVLILGGQNIIFGKSGDDDISAGTGTDWVFPGRGADHVVGGDGSDRIYDDDSFPGDDIDGGPGDDIIYSADGAADTIDCGDGAGDLVYADAVDTVSNCESAPLTI